MHHRLAVSLRWVAIASVLAIDPRISLGDDPPPLGSRLGRLFRPSSTKPAVSDPNANGVPTTYSPPPSPSNPSGPSPRIVPQPRVSRPVTESDPILSRMAIGRSDDGKQFGMSLIVYADGTVMDSEGVHHVGPDVLRPLVQAIQATETARVHGHCGAPPTDFIEQVHVVVFERAYGKLRASSFSYSGNPGNCDPSIKRLHAAVEAIQSRIAGSPTPSPVSTPVSNTPIGTPSPIQADPSPIPLTGP
jgi:hypothetical protein